jgi:ubiquinone biosynthesis monooxygenase Coq7
MAIRRPGPARNNDAIARMIRIDHAGEYGAVHIYRGQRAVFGRLPSKTRIARQLEHMEADEQAHLDAFDGYIAKRGVRPTALSPVWRLAGFGLGVATALMGEKAAHACTEAVESVIESHYGKQVEELEAMGESELAADFARYREEEVAHKDLAVDEGAHDAPGYPLLSALVRTGCHIAIKVTERI